MTIQSQVRTAGPFIGNGSATGGSFSFKVFAVTDLVGVETDTNGDDRSLVYGTDFNVVLNANQETSPGGTINYLIAGVGPSLIPTGYSLNFTSAVANLQPVKLTNKGGFFPSVINNALDRLTILLQQVKRAADASLKFPLSDGTGLSAELPPKAVRALKGIRFQADGSIGVTADDPDATAAAAAAAAASAASAAGSASTATTQAGIATSQAAAASASAASAAAAAAGMKYRAVRAASTGNVNIASAPSSLDGVSASLNDRWLLKDQSTPSQNGIYVFNGTGVALTRTGDMDTWAEVPGTVVVITEGSTNADTVWLCTSNDGGTLGTTAITFVDWAAVIINGSITNAKLANMGANTIKGSVAGGAPIDLTATQATAILNALVGDSGAGGTKGLAPAPGAGDAAADKFLHAGGSFLQMPRGAQLFTGGSGNYTTPANTRPTTVFKFTVTGGGGGSGGVNNGSSSGGGAGSTAIKWTAGLSASQVCAYVVGAGGTAGAATPTAGGNGGASSITIGGVTTTAPGGLGSGTQSGGAVGNGAAGGGNCTNANLDAPGGGGSPGVYQGNATGSGVGGSSMWGGGGRSTPSGTAAQAGQAPGSGAGGSFSGTTQAGAAGAPGLVLVEWW